jgi:DNA-binding response OmpR family regulator
LEGRNYEVTSAQTIASALNLVRQQQFDLFLLDSRLPDGSGIDLCKGIRQSDAHTPIIFYSAAAFDADKTMALGAGAQEYLTKPARLSELCDLILSLIEAAQNNRTELAQASH